MILLVLPNILAQRPHSADGTRRYQRNDQIIQFITLVTNAIQAGLQTWGNVVATRRH